MLIVYSRIHDFFYVTILSNYIKLVNPNYLTIRLFTMCQSVPFDVTVNLHVGQALKLITAFICYFLYN